MMRLLLISLSFVLFFAVNANAEIETKAKYALLLDYNTGEILFEKNPDEKMGPSSMTKLMTAYILFDALKRGDITLETKYPISEKAWRTGGSKMFVKEGDYVTVENLIQGIVVQSGNDACVVVAEGISGSEEAFAEDMNFMGKKLGLTGSVFKNATGLPNDEHLMTVRDLVTIAKHILDDFPEYYKYFSEKEFTYNKINQKNRNKLLYRDIGADGFKTGYTKKAGYGIVASAIQGGRRLILAINGLARSKDRITEAERLLRHGFRDFKNTSIFKAGDKVESAEVFLGTDNTVPLVINENVEFTLNKRVSMKSDIEMSVTYESPISAPIKKGTHIADLTIKKDGKVEKTIPLVAGKTVKKLSFLGRLKAIPAYYLLGK